MGCQVKEEGTLEESEWKWMPFQKSSSSEGKEYGQGALWRRQRPVASRTLGGRAPWEGRGASARESPSEAALGHKPLGAVSPRPIQPMNGWKGQPNHPFVWGTITRSNQKDHHIFYHPNQGTFWEWNEVLLIIPKGDHDSARPLPGKPNAGSTCTPTCSQDQEKVLPKPLHFFQDPLGELMDSSELPLWLSW